MSGVFRLLGTGSRAITEENNKQLRERLCIYLDQAVIMDRSLLVVQGDCESGVDFALRQWVDEMKAEGQPVDREDHPAKGHPTQDFGEWPGAGPRRNRYMASLGADVCLAMVDRCIKSGCFRPRPHDSHGTASCMEWAKNYGIELDVMRLWTL